MLRALIFLGLLVSVSRLRADDPGNEGFINSDGVKIHYVTKGEGPLVVLLHGFPDFWYTWRDQMPALASKFQVVALDLRGYNLSDQPASVDDYAMDKLVGDVAAAIRHFRREKATIVGHDWGGAIAWSFAMKEPEKTEKLIVLNMPHPRGFLRELANNPEQQKNSQYARNFQQPGAAALLKPEILALWVKEPDARKRYIEAFGRSSIEKMLDYYKANYPREPYRDDIEFPPVECPVLMIHGLDDQYLLPGALNGTWQCVKKDLTIVTVPGAGHFVHRDSPEFVTQTIVRWLSRP